jgi:MYXO-CTERM domain-containing protein
MMDTAMCETTETGLDDTGASDTTEPETEVTSTDPSPGDTTTSSSAGSSDGGEGCECSAGADRRGTLAMAGLGLVFGLVGARRRHRGRTGVAVMTVVLAGSSAQGCCDPMVATDTSSVGESSSTGDEGSTDSTSAAESSTATVEPAFPEWAIGTFSSDSDKVGMTLENPLWYWWNTFEITAAGTVVYQLYSCTELQERQEFRWILSDDGRSLSMSAIPPADVFTFGNGHQVSEVVVEPGDSCDTINIRYFHVETMSWVPWELQRGNVCAESADPDRCTFTFEWCDGEPPPPCE